MIINNSLSPAPTLLYRHKYYWNSDAVVMTNDKYIECNKLLIVTTYSTIVLSRLDNKFFM